ncbi:MAG: hypothetical protein RIK87_28705 [Fuerstiella sp.]
MSFRNVSVAATAAALFFPQLATAQFYSGGCSSCGTAAPTVAVTSCTPVQPVYSACYQTVPVTTYRQERQTVKVPYYKTAYEDREVTVYEPVTRQRTVEVPTVSYQNVVDNRVVHRDMGRWQTNYQPVARCSPCQVDPRPGLMGWLNRTGYSFRSAFTPNYRTSRQYVPNVVACNVATTRQVAVRGTRKVVVNETQMVARQKTERVEVRKLAWREEEVTVSRPVTAYRTVPIGSTLAYGYGAPSRMAWIVDDNSSVRSAEKKPEPDPNFSDPLRSANETFKEDANRAGDRTFDRSDAGQDGRFQRSSYERELAPPIETNPLQKPPRTFPQEGSPAPDFKDFNSMRDNRRDSARDTAAPAVAISAGGWKRSRSSSDSSQTVSNDSLTVPSLSMSGR